MKKPNIILITLDALRADHLGLYGYKKDTSPFIDSLAKKGVVFKNAFSTGASTPQSFTGIMTSTYPLDFGGYSRITGERTLISEVLQKAGYLTMGFHSNAYLSPYFGYGRDWDVFDYLSHFKEGATGSAMRSGSWQSKIIKKLFDWETRASERPSIFWRFMGLFEPFITTFRKMYLNIVRPIPNYYTAFEMNEAIKNKLPKNSKKPLFLWVHYMDAHDPYGLFMRYGNKIIFKIKSYLSDYLMTFFGEYPKINNLFRKLYIGMYDESIKNIDKALEELFKDLSEKGIINGETAIFITADHGEEFGEHGGFIHMQKGFNENVRVPLIVVAPQKFSGAPGVSEIPRSLIDIPATMLSFAKIKKISGFKGENIFDGNDRDIFVELSSHDPDLSGIIVVGRVVISEGYKLIKTKSGNFLFSLKDESEKENIINKDKNIVSRLGNKLEKFVKTQST